MLRTFRPLPIDSLRLLVFDLDGTLIDSRQDLCNSVNATLKHFNLRPLPDEVIASFIGDGAAML
ncbi:MAG TPA: HAD hydrolase-like protein, partial [Edaphobacter sp.]|nr:HAD hydrolase-like protein [Edaphobacter sp.]